MLHPLVGERVVAWREQLDGSTELAVVEVPLLFEAGMEPFFDATLVVVAPDERRDRVGRRTRGPARSRDVRRAS